MLAVGGDDVNYVNYVNDNSFISSSFVKGAPEKVRELLSVVPIGYDQLYTKFTLQGKRVIALAWKDLPNVTESQVWNGGGGDDDDDDDYNDNNQ